MSSIKDRVALLIGGASSVGFEYAKALIKCGAKALMIADVNKKNGEEVASKLGTVGKAEVDFLKTDVSDQVQLRYAFEETIERFKHLDITLNTVRVLDEADPEKTIRTNFSGALKATYMAVMEYLSKYRRAEEGLVVNAVSFSGLLPLVTCPVYSTTNHALVALGRSLGTYYYYKKYRTRILTVCPDVTELTVFRPEDMEGMEKILFEREENMKSLSSEQFGPGLMKAIECGTNGSVWGSGCDGIYEIPFPNRAEVRRKVKRNEFMRMYSK